MANANFIVQNGLSIGGSGGATITADPTTGAVAIAPAATVSNPNPTATVFTTSGTVTTVATTGGVANIANIATASNTATVGTGLTTLSNVTIGNIYVNGSTGTNGQFLSSNGAGLTWQTLSASSISNATSNITVNSGSLTFGIGGANVATFTPSTLSGSYGGNLVMNGSIIPSANITHTLGSSTRQWKDIYVGPGSLYVNGKAVIQDTSGTITFSTDINQNLAIQTSGTGDIQINPSGTGAVALQGTIKVTAGKNFTSSDGNAIGFSNQIAVDSITSKTADTDLTITAAGTGKVYINDNCTVTGNLTVSGTTTTINTTTLSVADNLIDLNSDVTTGTPTEDAGIRVMRGDLSAVQIKWAETVDAWQLTNDGSTYANIVTTSGGGGSVSFGALTASGNIVAASGTASTSTTTGALVVAGGAGISGNVFTGGWLVPTANVTQNLGTTTNYWNNIYGITFVGTSTTAKYADLAENYQADKAYMAGTVMMFGGSAEVTVADADTTRVAGIISTNPAHLMNGGLTGAGVVPLALQGRVPCQVIGPVHKGDIMVSAGHGFAKVNNTPVAGQAIGKALQEVTFPGKAVIEVVVGRV
jgi:hypothetical protein